MLNTRKWFDVGAKQAEAFGKIFVAACDGVDIAQDRATRSGEHGEEEDDSGTEGRRCHHFGGAPVGGAGDEDAVSVEEFDIGVQGGKFGGVDGAVFKYPVVD